MPKIFQIDTTGETRPWSQVHCANEERDLQNLLEKNYDLLCGEQIKPDNPRKWLLIKREMPVPDPTTGTDKWSIDFFFVDQEGMPTFVECKRYRDTRARREVIGQMLEYAANGQYYWDKDVLRQYAAKTTGGRLSDAIITLTGSNSLSVDEFLEQIITKLKAGEIRLIFFMEESPYELRSIVEFLNNQMELAEVLIVEAKQYTDGKSKLVLPILFGFTEQARQIKKSVSITRDSQRRKWDEPSFFQDAEKRLSKDQFHAVQRIYEFSKEKWSDVSWGTGTTRGSFNPRFARIGNKSVYSVYSDGSLNLNFGWLTDGNAAACRDTLYRQFPRLTGLNIPTDSDFPSIPITKWASVVEDVIQALVEVIDEDETNC